jgi:hypothetical protein
MTSIMQCLAESALVDEPELASLLRHLLGDKVFQNVSTNV